MGRRGGGRERGEGIGEEGGWQGATCISGLGDKKGGKKGGREGHCSRGTHTGNRGAMPQCRQLIKYFGLTV